MEADDLLKEIRTAFPQVSMPSKADLRFHPEGCHQCEYLSAYLDENRSKPAEVPGIDSRIGNGPGRIRTYDQGIMSPLH
jgi:hypothetical protein